MQCIFFCYGMKQGQIKHFSIATKVVRRPVRPMAVDCAGQDAQNKVSLYSVQEVLRPIHT